MTHYKEQEEVEEVDPFDMDMDSVEDISDGEDIDGIDTTDEDRIAIRNALEADKKTEQEIQLDQMDQLLKSRKCNTWERGFCDSCIAYLKSKRDAKLSYKQ